MGDTIRRRTWDVQLRASRRTRRVVGILLATVAVIWLGNWTADERARRPPTLVPGGDSALQLSVAQLTLEHANSACIGRPLVPIVVAERVVRIWERPAATCAAPVTSGVFGDSGELPDATLQAKRFGASVEFYTLFGFTIARATGKCGGMSVYCGVE